MGLKAQSEATFWLPGAAQTQSLQGLSDARKATNLVCPENCGAASCAAPTMALAHAHIARRLQFSASSDGLLLWLSEECWGYGPRSSHFNGVQAGHHAVGQRRFRLPVAIDLLLKGGRASRTPQDRQKRRNEVIILLKSPKMATYCPLLNAHPASDER